MSKPVATMKPETLVRARRRVQIALCLLEDGFYDLLTTNDIAGLLSAALEDLEEMQVVEPSTAATQSSDLDWNAWASLLDNETTTSDPNRLP